MTKGAKALARGMQCQRIFREETEGVQLGAPALDPSGPGLT